MITFEWDENKRIINIQKHGFDFIQSPEIFNNPLLIVRSDKDQEIRYKAISYIDYAESKKIVAIIYTLRKNNIRIISIRNARENEKKQYIKKYNLK